MSGRIGPNRRGGFVSVWVAVTLAAVLALVGLTLDTSHAYTVGRELQNAADSAALAAASKLSTSFSAAQTAAVSAAADNHAAGVSVQVANSDVVEGNYNSSTGVFAANTTPYNAVKVSARRTTGSAGGAVNMFFGGLVGLSTVNITRTAVAFSGGGGTSIAAGVILLDPSSSASLNMSGGGALTVGGSGGAIYVNSGSASAVQMSNGATITAANLDIVGDDSVSGSTINATVNTGQKSITDPLAALAEPTKTTDLGSLNLYNASTQTVGTGDQTAVYYYSGGISVNGGSHLTLNGGTYILGTYGLTVAAGTLTANNCMFYFTGSGSTWATATFEGGTTTTITAPTTGTYSGPGGTTGIALFQDRATPSSNSLTVDNGATVNITGTIYLPSVDVVYAGGTHTLGNQIIAYGFLIDNGAAVTVSYDGRNTITTAGTGVALGQ
jgi:Flp pilus assembly protein TadG